MRVWRGSPQNTVYGEPGWTCQDLNNGRLYVSDTVGTGGWHEVLTINGSNAGQVGDVLWHGPSGWTHRRFIADQNQVLAIYWDSGSRLLYDSGAAVSVNFDTRTLVDGGNGVSVNWNDGIYVSDSNATQAFDCTSFNRQLYDLMGGIAVDFDGRYLASDSGNATVYWQSGIQVIDDAGNSGLTISSTARYLQDNMGGVAVDFHNRALINGTNVLSWANIFATRERNASTIVSAPLAATGTQTVAPATGASVSPSSDAATILTYNINIAAGIAALTVALQTWLDSVPDGARITIFARSAITTLTVTATGYTFIGTAATTLAAGASIEYVKVGSSRTAIGTAGQLLRVR